VLGILMKTDRLIVCVCCVVRRNDWKKETTSPFLGSKVRSGKGNASEEPLHENTPHHPSFQMFPGYLAVLCFGH
jgi:hypothetical protein